MTASVLRLPAMALLVFGLSGGASAANAADIAGTRAAIDHGLDAQYAHIETLYKDIHSHPELGFQETRTAALLGGEMRKLGYEVTEHIGKTGIVAILKNGPGPFVMVRTELDALPMPEKTGLAYASTAKQMYRGAESPVAHSCGHDIHMSVWVAVAKTMLDMKDQWSGTLMFIGQPAEEGGGGAKAMLDDGLFARFGKPDYGYALHVGPGPFGGVSYKPGAISSSSDSLAIVFKGRGGHGSRPHVTVDPIMMAGHFIVDVQSVISREKDAAKFGVVTIGSVQAGNAGNVIPDTAELRGTIRSYDEDTRRKMWAGIERTAKGVAVMAGAPEPEIKLTAGARTVINDADVTARGATVLKAAFGDKARLMSEPGSASEDYSEFVMAGVPSFFFSLGGLDPKDLARARETNTPVPGNHSPEFAPVPEPTIRAGTEAMSLVLLDRLKK